MKKLIYSISFLVSMFFSNVVFASDNETDALKKVIEVFKSALIEKDYSKLNSIFYSENVPFIVVFSDEMLAQKRKERPKYPSSIDFSKFGSSVKKLISAKEHREEKIWNVKININGKLASIHFDYSDHINHKKRSFGKESWSLVKEEENWKIVSVTYTVTEV